MTTLKEHVGSDAEGADAASPAAPRGWHATLRDSARLIRRHIVISIAIVVAVVVRLVALLGFQPAILFRLDSYDYLWGAAHLSPNVVNASGYSFFLRLLMPFHSLALVAAIQHVMGIGLATAMYALARRHGLPDWGATLAVAPVLLDPAQILVEQLVMADLSAMALMVGSFCVLLWRSPASLPRVLTAGLMMGGSVIIRPTTLPLVLLVPVFLLLKEAKWRTACVSLLAGVLPVLGYMSWFAAVHGSFNLTDSNGLFLWSRTMSFANCAMIRPPADLRPLCPAAQPGYLARPDPAKRPQPMNYLWARRTWQWRHVRSGFVPDTAAFTPANNYRALRFAVDAIAYQPAAYLGVVARDALKPFLHTDNLRFPAVQVRSADCPDKAVCRYAIAAVRAYTGSSYGMPERRGYDYRPAFREPYAHLMIEYQRIVFLPGPVLGLIMMIGLAGIIVRRRRTPAAALLWASAVTIMLLPVAEHEYAYRYVLPAVPLACFAAAIATRIPGQDAAKESTRLDSP